MSHSVSLSESTDPIHKKRTATLFFCSSVLPERAYAGLQTLIETYWQNPQDTLINRLASLSDILHKTPLSAEDFAGVEAKLFRVDDRHSMLCFNFTDYSGLFRLNENAPGICPHFAAVIFDHDYKEEPIVYSLEPAPEQNFMIRLLPDQERMYVSETEECTEQAFFIAALSSLGAVITEARQEESSNDKH